MNSVTFDSGALIAIERRKKPFLMRLKRMQEVGTRITVPAVVITEWWRGGTDRSWRDYVGGYVIEASDSRVTRLAGEAMAAVPNATAIDAIVMASAALRGDIVYTSDFDDLMRLQAYFRGVRVFRVLPRADE